MENEYYKNKLKGSISSYRNIYKIGFYNLRNLENLIDNSDNIPLSTIYTMINHLEREKAKVVREINSTIQELVPEKEPTSQESEPKQSIENTEAQTKEKTQEKKAPEPKQESKPEKSGSNEVSDSLEDSDNEFDLEE